MSRRERKSRASGEEGASKKEQEEGTKQNENGSSTTLYPIPSFDAKQ